MKNLLLLFCVIFIYQAHAAIKTTVADGDWFDANNWDPAGVPINEDTVIINHIITASDVVDYAANWMIIENNAEVSSDTIFSLHGNYKGFGSLNVQYFASGDGDSTLVYGQVTGDHFAAGNPVTINFGNVFSDTLSIASEFENRGLLDVNSLSTSGATFINRTNAAINVAGLATFSSTSSTNESNATITATDFVTSANFMNNGDVSSSNWTHGSGTVDGTTGRFCIDLCFINNSTINGSVDVCDSSPGGFCDVNMGTIAGTVTNCANGTCGNNVGLTEVQPVSIELFPNPAKNSVQVKGTEQGSKIFIYDITGKEVYQMTASSKNKKIDVSKFNKDIYIVRIALNNRSETKRLVVH